ncbi:hypothetical protein ACFE04_028361 [Oxalis oulophora]
MANNQRSLTDFFRQEKVTGVGVGIPSGTSDKIGSGFDKSKAKADAFSNKKSISEAKFDALYNKRFSKAKVKTFFNKKSKLSISKPKANASSKKKSKLSINQSSDLITRDSIDHKENLLRQFDLNGAYGPCIGMTRMARWQRAHCFGLNPPIEIKGLLKDGKVQAECSWYTSLA